MKPLPAKPLTARRFKTLRSISALVLREMDTTYGRSPGGYLWAVLEPLAAITLFTIVISLGLRLRSPSLGNNFMLFYATGFLPYMFFMQTSNKAARALKYSKSLLLYPRVTYFDAIVSRFILNTLTFLVIFYILLAGIHIGFGLDFYIDMPSVIVALSMTAMLGLGIGVLNSFLMAFFPLWGSFWTVLTRPLFLLSTIIYIFEEVPWVYQDVVWYNPVIHIVGLMRRGFYPTYDAAYVSVTYVFGMALVTLLFGLIFLARWNKYLLTEQ